MIRILIWARESMFGHKDPGDFSIAVCELAGQMLIYNKEAYATLSEETVIEAHRQTCETAFRAVKTPLIELFSD